MDGEEMVMSETLQVLPDPSHSIITVTQFVGAQVEFCPSGWMQKNESYESSPSLITPKISLTRLKKDDFMLRLCA